MTRFLQLDAAVTRCLDKVCAGRQATEDNSAEWLLHLPQQQSHSELLLLLQPLGVRHVWFLPKNNKPEDFFN